MKILQLISSAGFFGAENVVLELSRELDCLNIKNTIGVFENSQNPHIEIALNAGKHNLKTEVFKCRGRVDVKTILDIKRFVQAKDIDIIHTHGYKSDIYGLIVAKLLKKPVMSTIHNWTPYNLVSRIYCHMEKVLLRNFNMTVAVAEDIRDELLRINVREDKIALIFNGVKTNKFDGCKKDLREEFNIDNNTKIVGTVGRLVEDKGLFNLLNAASEISNTFENVRFMIVGDGPLRGELEKKSIELGIAEKVIFTGLRNDVPEVYSTFDIFALPSLKEGLPMVLLEAMASKKPIVATTVGAIPRVIANTKDGILANPGDVCGLKAAIISLLQDERLSRTLAYSAYRKVIEEFSSSAMCAKYVCIYERLLNSKKLLNVVKLKEKNNNV